MRELPNLFLPFILNDISSIKFDHANDLPTNLVKIDKFFFFFSNFEIHKKKKKTNIFFYTPNRNYISQLLRFIDLRILE